MKRWSLAVLSPDQAPQTVENASGEQLVVGSLNAPGVLALDLPGVAPRHALLQLRDGRVRVEALDPAGAVFVGGQVISAPVELPVPASIRLGEVEIKISVLEDAQKVSSEEATERLVHPAVLYSKPLAYPSSPEMTGRIYCAPVDPASEDGGREDERVGCDEAGAEEKTMAFSFESEDVPLADRMSMAVDYAPQSEIARGGMGKIFSAEDSTLGREVALKVSMGKDARQEAQFFREARVLAQLARPNIVPIHSFGTDSLGRPFYSMKLVRGRTLQAILKQLQAGDAETASVFTRQRLLDVFRKVCDAVASAHAKGYLHRDLKLENIMVGEYGEVLVMDWGLVKGLPNHPGQLRLDPGQTDERSDIYALGGILFAILTLRPPVTGSSVKDVLRKVRDGEIGTKSFPAGSLDEQTPSAAVKTVPGALMAVALKALARDREKRYSSVEALVADIEAYQAGFATVAEEATLLRLMTLFVRRHRAASVLAAVLMVAAGLFAVRLAASERLAQQNATRADQYAASAERESRAALANAQLARDSASRAVEQARIAEANAARAVAEKEAARRATADASIANAEAAEKTLNADYIRNALEAVPEDLRTQEWEYLNRFLDSSERTIVVNRGSYWKDCVPHPQRPGVLVTLEPDNWVRFLDLKDGSVEDVLELKGVFAIGVLAVSEDSKKLAVISTESEENKVYKHSIKVFGLTDGKSLLSIPILDPLRAVLKFSADGRFLMKTYRRAWAQGLEPALYDLETGAACWPAAYAGMYDADFVPSDSGVSKPLVNWASKNHGLVQIAPFWIASKNLLLNFQCLRTQSFLFLAMQCLPTRKAFCGGSIQTMETFFMNSGSRQN